jgi:hypothetical protein
MTTDTPEPRYERFTVQYPVSGTTIDAYYCGGATLREAQVGHPMAVVAVVADSQVRVEGGQ